MIKASFIIGKLLGNKVFDLSDTSVNRDNYAFFYHMLRQLFLERGVDLSTPDLNPPNEAGFVIFNDMPKANQKVVHGPRKYLLALESVVIQKNNFDIKFHAKFRKVFTWHDSFVDGDKYVKVNYAHLFPENIRKGIEHKDKLCTLISGNKQVSHPLELYSKRVDAIRWFEEHYPQDFDLYGVGWEDVSFKNKYVNYILTRLKLKKALGYFVRGFPSYKGKVESKKPILERYRFAICYENARDIPGYITEKIFDCFFAGCVPIYWGANNIEEHIPKECFIDKREYPTYEGLYDRMINMSDEEYLSYLDNIEHFLKSSKADPFRAETFAKTIVDTILEDLSLE